MKAEVKHDSASELQRGTSMLNRLAFGFALIIAIIFATLILPPTSMSHRRRRELVAENPFHGFTETTKQYIVFCGTLIVGCVVASDQKPKTQRNRTRATIADGPRHTT